MRTLLFQASLPARFWAESLHTATYLINRLPSTASPAPTPHHALFGTPPRYDHLRVFGCACYPNTSATAPHKLAPRLTRCVFLGYSPDHKGYRCFDLTSRRVMITRHVVFDESVFPFSSTTTPASDLELESLFPTDPVVQPPLSERSAGPPPVCLPDAPVPFPVVPAAPRAAPVSPAAPRAAPEAPSSSAASRAAPEAPLSLVGPRAAPRPPLRYAQPVRVYQRRTVVSPAPTPPLPASPVQAPSTSPPAGPPEPPRHPRLAARVESTVYHPPVLERDPRHLHPMVTRRAAGVLRPAALSTAAAKPGISPVPSSVHDALADPQWRRAMEEEYAALLDNQTWDLVPPPPGGNVVTDKWIWTNKRRADGTLDRYKARWVLRDFTQRPGVD
ncbi:hypothetical protein U9M48_013674 [Paspalum notatum var. saurae]|uniref:Retroviral polymerase SH3-like domain-containing protein n=1 Tax=Paspalum notatum var. saurae TaxID=547442 RepID=A0AAQ3WJP2_PASNO